MSDCTHDCSSCNASCSSRKKESLIVPLHEKSLVKKVIGVVSGKGGVGKSLVTSLLAVGMNRKGYHTAILDADITGPSIPKAFGLHGQALGNENELYPVKSSKGTDVMSINVLMPNESDPVIWRGPILAGMVKQFWSQSVWEDVDYMFVDMPPGTGDVPLTVFQSLPLDGIVIVTSPQDLVTMVVSKAVKMAMMMDIPILGIVENMSYFVCPNCNEKHYIYGESKVEEIAAAYEIPNFATMPINPEIAPLVDAGRVEDVEVDYLDSLIAQIERL
ncbi:MAG: Mrp/NBP35 family ATP-binding protein [Christensenellaceae bacterium]|nr:Mrp/NBP35 family ATP-binding protein [Christensenellaceae bacterium]